MLETGYPDPKDAYFGIPLGEEMEIADFDPVKVQRLALNRARDEFGPAVVSLLELLELCIGR
jgi:hypothetical protein